MRIGNPVDWRLLRDVAMITKTGGDMLEKRTAVFSDCERYRYLLRIVWDETKSLCQFVGLNPSTADEMKDDPTLRRVKDFARRWGHGGVLMTNLFAFRATKPDDMMRADNPNGEGSINQETILSAASEVTCIVAAWGKDGAHIQTGYAMKYLLQIMGHGRKLHCFKLCQNGEPYHPLYMAADTPLQVFK